MDKCPCRSCKNGGIRDRGLHSTLPIPNCANSVLYVDYTEMPKFRGYDFTLVVTCGLTRFTRVFHALNTSLARRASSYPRKSHSVSIGHQKR